MPICGAASPIALRRVHGGEHVFGELFEFGVKFRDGLSGLFQNRDRHT